MKIKQITLKQICPPKAILIRAHPRMCYNVAEGEEAEGRKDIAKQEGEIGLGME